MKIFIFIQLALISLGARAQDCAAYYFMQKNKTIEIAIYSPKHEPNGKQVYKVSDVSNAAGVTTASMNSEMYDKKNKLMNQSTGNIRCNGSVLYMDLRMNLSQKQQQQYEKATAKVQDAFLEYPFSMKIGDQLKDGNLNLDITTGGMQQNLILEINNRKVTAEESVTTAAGTWNCFRIEYKTKTIVKSGPISIPINLDATDWFAPGFGVVKTKSKYGITELTSVK